jgi:hypothetical protein
LHYHQIPIWESGNPELQVFAQAGLRPERVEPRAQAPSVVGAEQKADWLDLGLGKQV